MDYPKSVPGVGLVAGKFIDENTITGQVGSLVPSAWGNAITDELLAVILEGGLVPNEDNKTQLRQAIKSIIAKDSQPFAQILKDFVTNNGWGLGQNTPQLINNANTAIYPGFYSAGGAGATNFGDAYSPLLVMRRQSGNIVSQLQINARDNVLLFRGSADNGATWLSWVSVWNSGNLVKTTSPTDTTPGAMLKVADHGVGGQCVSTETNLNLYRTGGKYVTPATGLTGLPPGWVQGRHTIDVCGGSSYCMQLLTGASANQGRIAFRTASDAVFEPWREFAHTGNNSGLAPGAIGGFEVGRLSDDTVTVSPGRARDSLDSADLLLSSLLAKRLQSAGNWAAGTNGNGLFSGVRANNTWYHVFVVKKDADSTVDIGFDTSVTAANRPAGYNSYRLLGSVRTDAVGALIPFIMDLNVGGGRRFRWVTPVLDAIDSNVSTAAKNVALSVPPGRSVDAEMSILIHTNNIMVYFSPLDTADLSVNTNSATGTMTGYTGGYGSVTDATIDSLGFKLDVRTDVSAQIRARSNTAGKYSILTFGWTE